MIVIVSGVIIIFTATITYTIRSGSGRTWLAVVAAPPITIYLAYLEQKITLGYMDPFFPIAAGSIFLISLLGVALGMLIFHRTRKNVVYVKSIIVKTDDRLIVKIKPDSKFIEVYEYIYRAGKGVYWDNNLDAFYIKIEKNVGNLSCAEGFHIIREAVNDELGIILRIKSQVEWVNVDSKTMETILKNFQ